MNQLKDILFAQSVAVVGASGTPGKMGHTILSNLLRGAFEGPVYPINPRETTILGQACYQSLSELPGQVDLIVVCVPAGLVAGVMEQAAGKGVKGAIVISGGFKEIGNSDMERQLLELARRHDIRVIGPNCQGVNYTANRLCATWPFVKTRGVIGVVSQSGTIGAELELLAEKDGIGVSCFAALGNKLDISEADFIDFFTEDPHTRVIALNIEGIQEAPGFIEAVTRAARRKPVVVLKPGRTKKGVQAVASHTRSVAGNDKLFSVFCRKYGIMRANDMTEFYDFCKIAACMEPPKGNKLLIMTSSGGSGILATDTAEENGVDVIPLDAGLKGALARILPPQCVLSNPLDMTGDATADRYADVLSALAAHPERAGCDLLLPIFGDPIPGACEVVKKAGDALGLPMAVSYLGGGEVQEAETARMNAAGIPVFPTPERAVKAMAALLRTKYGNQGEL